MIDAELIRVEEAIKTLRTGKIIDEYELQVKIAVVLDSHGIKYKKEYQLGRGNRIDFLTDQGIGVEIKKGKPNRSLLLSQVNRYSEFEEIKAMVVIIETSLKNPFKKSDNGKRCQIIGLQKLWGIAL